MRRSFAAVLVVCGLLGGAPVAAQEDPSFMRGDVNQDRVVDISDTLSVLFYLFRGGFQIGCEKAADLNDDGALNVSDALYGLEYLFKGGPVPPAPFDRCGADPTPDGLSCDETPCRVESGTIIISEVLASNDEGLVDEDGDSSDWFELHLLQSAPDASMDLGGWFVTDDPLLDELWEIPAGVTIERGGFLVIFASGKDRAVAGEELHTDYQLNAEGDYLAIVAPDGVTVIDEYAPEYPEQLTDVSYGPAQSTTTLVQAGTTVRYRVPTAGDSGLGTSWTELGFNTAGWSTGQVGLGFSGIATEGFDVTYVKANVAVDHLTVATNVLNNPGMQSQVVVENAPYIDYFNSGGSGNYSNDRPFPGTGPADVDDFVIDAVGTVMIPQAGAWTFGVNSDDGFGFELTNGAQTWSMSFPTPRGPADTLQVFNLPQAGPYQARLVFYERGGGAGVELFAAQGSHTTFNATFRLVGDTSNGGLGLLGFAADIRTDIGSVMRNVNASLWTRLDFNVADVGGLGGLILRMKYADGFVAYLNGAEVARRNAPGSPQWNSSATTTRPLDDIGIVEEINLTDALGQLQTGANVLAIHALNNSAGDANFLVLPELVAAGNISERQYMVTPTPGAFNVPGSVDFVRDVEFSVEHGFYDASFSLALSTPTPGAQIRYTRDGSTPTATSGTVYSGQIAINGTSVVRAAAFRASYLDSDVTTQTYLFLNDVIRQSPTGQSPGPGWPTGSVNGQILDYGMDPDIVNSARWSGQIVDALLSIPSISLVTDVGNLFSASTGIYVNAGNDGRAWERRTSVELIHPDGTPGFAVEAGLRIRGAFSRSDNNPKHSFRLFFRREYGVGRLDYPLFGGEGVDEFDKIDLRTSQNYSWAFEGSTKNTFMRDVFSRDVQRDMGQPHTRSRYYHLYLNGQYWGLFQTEERADADFAESYLGGSERDYDVVKNDSSASRALQATDGTIAAYRRLYDAAVAGFASDTAYLRVLGLRPDGTVDPAGEQLVDPENLIDYMACTYYTGDPDAPVSAWAHFSNNVFAIYNRERRNGFKWFRHDAEHSLGASGGLNEARLLTDPTDRGIGQLWQHFNPAWLHLRLTANEEYLMLWADRVNKYFSNGGILSAGPNRDRWMERKQQIDLAVIGASARWGDSKVNPPRTRDDWQNESNWMTNTWFPQRTQIVINQMRSVNMFPDAAIVSFNRQSGPVDPGFQVVMTQANGNQGTIYYTTDGSDPRLWGGGLNPDARVFSDDSVSEVFISRGSTWRFWDQGTNLGTGWRALGYNDAGWGQGPAELGYGDGGEATEVGFGGDPDNKYPTTYFRHTFNVTDASSVISLSLGIVRDDGAAVYLNGTEAIPRINLPAGAINYLTYAEGPGTPVGNEDESTFFTFDVDPGLLQDGTNIVAVEIHQNAPDSSDISFDLELTAITAGAGGSSVVIDDTTTVNARVRSGAEWGALTEARFTVGLDRLVINEIMAANSTTLEDPQEPGEFPDWIELYNGTAAPIDLGGMFLSDDLQNLTQWQIPPGVVIGAGQYLIFYADDDGTQGPQHTNYKLSQSGEPVVLVDTDAQTMIDVIIFPPQFDDVSYGRYPDADDEWGFHAIATPGAPNSPHAP